MSLHRILYWNGWGIQDISEREIRFWIMAAEILRKVFGRILESYYSRPREILLFFYYPSDEYVSYLMTVEELTFLDEIDCGDLLPGKDPRERVLIFNLSPL